MPGIIQIDVTIFISISSSRLFAGFWNLLASSAKNHAILFRVGRFEPTQVRTLPNVKRTWPIEGALLALSSPLEGSQTEY